MAKALELSADTLTAPPVPKAAQIAAQFVAPKQGREAAKMEARREPLQVRWPPEDVKAAKLAAIQDDFPTVSDFLLACFHAYMKSNKQA
jgi:hypothetical protein